MPRTRSLGIGGLPRGSARRLLHTPLLIRSGFIHFPRTVRIASWAELCMAPRSMFDRVCQPLDQKHQRFADEVAGALVLNAQDGLDLFLIC